LVKLILDSNKKKAVEISKVYKINISTQNYRAKSLPTQQVITAIHQLGYKLFKNWVSKRQLDNQGE